jgi:hypothetical protein
MILCTTGQLTTVQSIIVKFFAHPMKWITHVVGKECVMQLAQFVNVLILGTGFQMIDALNGTPWVKETSEFTPLTHHLLRIIPLHL